MEHKYQIFKQFNWAYSTEWKNYYNNIYPSPPITKLLHYKKKFYRIYIDPDFDIDYVPPEGEKLEVEYKPPPDIIQKNLRKKQKQDNNEINNNFNKKEEKSYYEKIVEKYELSKKNYKPMDYKIFKFSQIFFLIISMLSILFGIKTYKLVLDGFLIKLFREIGKPIFSKEYLQNLLLNDTFHTLIYIFLCSFDNYFNYYMLLPVIISTFIDLAEELKDIKFFSKNVSIILNNKENIAQLKTDIEIIIGFLQILGVFLSINSFKVLIIYWNILRFRYMVNPYVYKGFEKINIKVNNFKDIKGIPSVIKYIISQIQLMFNYFGHFNFKK